MDLNANDVSQDSMIWRAVAPDRWLRRDWGEGEVVLFNENSGDTHLLAEFGERALSKLAVASNGLSLDQLLDQLLGTEEALSDASERAEAKSALESALLEFRRLGLAEHHPS